VTVDGAGSKWVTSSLTVGQFASGTLTVTNGGQVQCAGSGIIGDNAGATGSVTVDGAGSRLTVTNDLTVGNSGTGTLSVTGGGVLNTAALLRVSNTGSVTANGGTVCAGQLAGTGPITLTNPTGQDALIITGAAGGASYGGVIDGTGSVRKTGGGTQTFTGANLYSGGTTVAGGILFVNNTTGSGTGTGPVAVTAGGTLGGSGRIAGAVTVGSGGVVAPGDTAATTGVLTLANGITLAGGSTFAVKLNGATAGGQYDQLYVTGGAVDLGGSTLSASLGNPPGLTDNWFIIVNRGSGPVIGTFDGLPQGASFPLGSTTAYISYTGDFATGLPYGGNDVMISMQVTPVPEPGAVLGVAAAGLVLAALRRRGRTAEYTRHRRHVVDLSVTA
jgi:T5SS/PEP-CTERM-associated repeat protein/autotransporter-associated beta strand protein